MTDECLPTTSPQQLQQAGGLFANSSNTLIQGGEFTVQNNVHIVESTPRPVRIQRFEILTEHVATSAFHNSGNRVDPPRCHENTRKAVLEEIFSWIVQDAARTAWIMWLNGAAGAGKSAICQSIAELCIKQGVLVASFFFFRTDPTRNGLRCLVATLAYQLMRLVPETKQLIIQTIESDPLIFSLSLDAQLEELVIKPLRWLKLSGQMTDTKWRFLFIIDGVDECEGDDYQVSVIHSIANILAAKDLPLLVLFGSRAESQLKMAFSAPKVAALLRRLPLDDNYLADQDIHLFLTDRFAELRLTHPLSALLDAGWPAPPLVQEIVAKSSGQFIYAAVVMAFVASLHRHPARQLEIVRGLRPSGRATPFAQLDALYRHIFAQAPDLPATAAMLAFLILGQGVPDVADIAWFFGVQAADVHVAFAELGSLVVCEGGRVRFLHASLPDFLADAARAHEYYIDPAEWGAALAVRWLRNIAAGEIREWHPRPLLNFLKCAARTPELRACCAQFVPAHVAFRATYVEAMGDMRTDGDTDKPKAQDAANSKARASLWTKLTARRA